MFGISFTKVVVLVAVVAIVWFGYRWFQRWDKERREAERREEAAQLGRQARRPGARDAEEMTACRVCGTYVAPTTGRSCGRPNCPFPRA